MEIDAKFLLFINCDLYFSTMRIKDNISDEFGEFSKNYTNDMIGCVPYYLELIESFVESLPKNFQPKTILDLGCGNGNITARLLELFPNAGYVLLDASPQMLALCNERFKNKNSTYIESYFQNYTFKENYFDLIVAGFSLHHCNSKEKENLFRSIFKSLKKGGLFSFSDLMISKTHVKHPEFLKTWKVFVDTNFPDGKKWKWLKEHYDEFDKPDDFDKQLKWLRKAGFMTIETRINKNDWKHIQAIKID